MEKESGRGCLEDRMKCMGPLDRLVGKSENEIEFGDEGWGFASLAYFHDGVKASIYTFCLTLFPRVYSHWRNQRLLLRYFLKYIAR